MAQLIVQVLADASQYNQTIAQIQQQQQAMQRGFAVPIGGAAQQQAVHVNNLAQSYVGLRVINEVTGSFKDALSTMRAVDDELVTIRKVTDATVSELDALTKKGYEIGSKYGQSADSFLSNVAAFSRAGYKGLAEGLGELAVKTQLVGDMNQQTAVQMLLSVDAAYKYQGSVEKLSAVLDGMNEIDNNFATSMEKVSAGLGKVAPIASQAGVGVDELSAAIGTVTAVTQRSGEEAATALRALFLNIMGDTKTEIADGATWTAGEIAGLRDVLNKYAPDAVAAAEATGSLINPMEAIGGLAQSMKDGLLTERQLMAMVTDIGGKLRSSQLLALIQNWDMYNSMLTSFGGAVGSADREVSNALDSWSVKAARAKNVFAEMVSEFVDSKAIKTGFDIITDGLENMENGIPKILSLAASFKATQIALNGIGASRGLSALVSFVTGNWQALAITAALAAAYKLYDVFTTTAEEQKEQFEEANAAYQEEQTKLENINTELQTKQERMQEILNMDSLTPKLQEELDVLKQQTEELRIQAALQDAKAADSRTSLAKEAVESAKELTGAGGTVAQQLTTYQEALEKLQKLSELSKQTAADLDLAKSFGDNKAAESLRQELVWIDDGIQTERGILDSLKAEIAASYETLDALDKTFTDLFAKEGYTHKSATDAYWNDETFFNSGMAFWLQAWDSVIASKKDAADVLGIVSDGLKDNGEKANNTTKSLEAASQALRSLAENASSMADETREATDALSALEQKLKETGEVGDSFKQFQDAYATAMELFGNGMVGSREFQGIADIILGDDIMRELQWDYQKAGEMLGNEFFQAMFTGGEEDFGRNAIRYLADTVGTLTDESGNLIASFEEVDGNIEVAVNDFDALADAVGVSADVLMTMFDALGIFNSSLNTSKEDILGLIDGLGEGVTKFAGGVRSVDVDGFVNSLAKMGKSEKEITKLFEAAKDMPEIKFTGDTDDVTEKIQKAVEEANAFQEETYQAKADVDTEPAKTGFEEADQAGEEFASKTYTATAQIKFTGIVGGGSTGSGTGTGSTSFNGNPFNAGGGLSSLLDGNAKGTKNAKGGPTLVNELGPELISENGHAYIANGGKPTIVDLSPGAVVLTAEETEQVEKDSGVPKARIGAAFGGRRPTAVNDGGSSYSSSPQWSGTVPGSSGHSSGGGSNGGGGSSADSEAPNDDDWWQIISDHYNYAVEEAERAIARIKYQLELIEQEWEEAAEPIEDQIDAYEKMNGQIDRQIELMERERDALTKPINDQIEAMRAAKKEQDEQLELAERQKAVEEARANLQNAQNERNVRYFNAEKGQWEWMADQGAVQQAQDELASAEQALADHEYDMQISELEKERDKIEQQYQDQISELEDQQTANEDAIYELEQQLEKLREQYAAIMDPLEDEQQAQENVLAGLQQQWADIEHATSQPEGDLQAALNAVSGTTEGQNAASLMEAISSHNDSLIEVPVAQIWPNGTATVPTLSGTLNGFLSPSQNLFSSITTKGFLPPAGSASSEKASSTTVIINGITIDSSDPMSLKLGDLVEMGIYQNMG